MKVENVTLERKYHDAVEHWRRHHFKDYETLLESWERYFPKDEKFCLCAKMELNTPDVIHIGAQKGEAKRHNPEELTEDQAHHLLAIIKAQASTEFGSIQQHAGTIDRAHDDQDRAWVMRVMAEELRHGYQMLHLLLSKDWSHVSGGVTGPQMVEEILSMTTGNHVLDAFNLDYDSFMDNIAFAAIIDRVGKYQLTMQKVCAYKPMADSMPPMLREEAFHLAAGVIPLRRFAERAAKGDPLANMRLVQESINKWFPRGLEMFGDERGGQKNMQFGFKDMTNREAVIDELERTRGAHLGLEYADLLYLPDARFFRRKGEPAFQMIGVQGETFTDVDTYLRHLAMHLNDGYVASRDMRLYAETLRKVVAGEMSVEQGVKAMPKLKRVGGTCPCSKSVRWVMEESNGAETTVMTRPA